MYEQKERMGGVSQAASRQQRGRQYDVDYSARKRDPSFAVIKKAHAERKTARRKERVQAIDNESWVGKSATVITTEKETLQALELSGTFTFDTFRSSVGKSATTITSSMSRLTRTLHDKGTMTEDAVDLCNELFGAGTQLIRFACNVAPRRVPREVGDLDKALVRLVEVASGLGWKEPAEKQGLHFGNGGKDALNSTQHNELYKLPATDSLGALGYTVGEDIALNASGALHTAAHEAAHVVHQQTDVQLKDGLGQVSDEYEVHADRVEDKVVLGESAEELLGQMAPKVLSGNSTMQSKSVQLNPNQQATRSPLSNNVALTNPSNGIMVWGELVTANPKQQRLLLEKHYIEGGMRGVELFSMAVHGAKEHAEHELERDSALREDLGKGWDVSAGVPLADETVEELQQVREKYELVLTEFNNQETLFLKEISLFLADFEIKAEAVTDSMLDGGMDRAQAEIKRYGLSQEVTKDLVSLAWGEPVYGSEDKYSGGDNEETQKLSKAAALLVASQRDLNKLRQRKRNVQSTLQQEKSPYEAPSGVLIGGMMRPTRKMKPSDPEEINRLEALMESLEEKVGQAEQKHWAQIIELEAEFPIISSCKTEDGQSLKPDMLESFASEQQRADALGRELFPVLENIAKTRAALQAGELSVWKENRIIGTTQIEMLVQEDSWHHRAIRDKAADEQSMDWTDWAVIAVTFALAGLAAIPTGGSSLAAGLVVAAEVGALAVDAFLIMDAIEDYKVQSAAAGTDFDQARAIAAEEPTLAWLAIDIAGTGIGLAAAMKTFREIRHVRRAALAAKSSDEIAQSLMVISRAHDEGRITSRAKKRLEENIAAGGTSTALNRKAKRRELGVSGGRTKRADWLDGEAPTAEQIAKVTEEAAQSDARTLAKQMESITTEQPRSARDVVIAAEEGIIPRYIARVGTHPDSFAHPNKKDAFAADIADLRGLKGKPEMAMSTVGWEAGEIMKNKQAGKTVYITVIDTKKIPKQLGIAEVDMAGLQAKAMRDMENPRSRFAAAAVEQNIRKDDLPKLFAELDKVPPGAPRPRHLKKFQDVLAESYSANKIYSGTGFTVTDKPISGRKGNVGAREFMVSGDFKLASEGKRVWWDCIEIGTLLPEEGR